MENKENVTTKKLSKQEYNRQYYLKNKNRLSETGKVTGQSEGKVFDLFRKKHSEDQTKKTKSNYRLTQIIKWAKILSLLTLATAITYFLVTEAARYYLNAQESPAIAYLKAGMVEGAVIVFSVIKSNRKLVKWAQKIVVFALCIFTIGVMSGRTAKTAMDSAQKVRLIQQTLHQLESEVSQKEQLRSQFLSRNQLTLTRRYEKGLDESRSNLVRLRGELATLSTPGGIMIDLSIPILLRLLLMVVNIICFHIMSELLTAKNKPADFHTNVSKIETT